MFFLLGATQAAWELQVGASATGSGRREQLRLQLDSSSDPCLPQPGVIDLPRWSSSSHASVFEAVDLPRLTCHDGDGLALEGDGLPLRAEAALSTTSLSRRAPLLADGERRAMGERFPMRSPAPAEAAGRKVARFFARRRPALLGLPWARFLSIDLPSRTTRRSRNATPCEATSSSCGRAPWRHFAAEAATVVIMLHS